MDLRRRTAIPALTIGLALAGCASPVEQPMPTPSFADAETAYAAAEATYRAYVDALNAVDLSDPTTFEDVFQWTTGEVNAADRETLSTYHAEGLTVSGDSVVTWFEGDDFQPSQLTVAASACSDVSRVQVMSLSGESIVPPERPDVYTLRLEFVQATSNAFGLALTRSTAVEGKGCAP